MTKFEIIDIILLLIITACDILNLLGYKFNKQKRRSRTAKIIRFRRTGGDL